MSANTSRSSADGLLARRLADVLAFALQLIGATKTRPFKGSLDDLLSDERVGAALGMQGKRIVSLAWLLAADRRSLGEGIPTEESDLCQLELHVAAVLPDQARALLDATPLSCVSRISEPRIFTPADSVQAALDYSRANDARYFAYAPEKGEPGLVSLADIGLWYAHEVVDDPYDEPIFGSTSLMSCNGQARRDWRVVDSSMSVGRFAELMTRADRRLCAALVLSPTGTPQGVVEAREMAAWQHPSRSMRDRAHAVLGLWKSRSNQSAKHANASAADRSVANDRQSYASEAKALLGIERVADGLLDIDDEGRTATAEEIRKLVAPLGSRGVEPSVLLDALLGHRTREVADLRLDANAGFGSGALLSASFIGQVLQRLADRGFLVTTPFGTLACSPTWGPDADLSWMDDAEAGDAASRQTASASPDAVQSASRDPDAAFAHGRPAPLEGAMADGGKKPQAADGPSSDAALSASSFDMEEPDQQPKSASSGSRTKDQPADDATPARRQSQSRASAKQETPASAKKAVPPLKPLPYVPYQGQRQTGSFYKAGNLLSVSAAVIRAEGPIASSLLVRRVASLWGITKVSSKVRARLKEVLPQAGTRAGMMVTEFNGERFYMTPAQHARPQVRTNKGAQSGRASSEIPLEEIGAVVSHELASGPAMRTRLVVRICEAFGLDSSKRATKRMADLAVDELARRGRVQLDGKQVSLR